MHINLPIVICFAPGAGGNFVNSALWSALFGGKLKLSDSGNAHSRHHGDYFNPSDSIEGIQGELDIIKQLKLADNNAIVNQHYKNLVALQAVHPQLWFIKITHNTESEEQCNLLYQLNHNKVGKLPWTEGIKDDYQEGFLRFIPDYQKQYWPESYKDMVNEMKDPNSKLHEFNRNNSLYTFKTWYWIENVNTRKRTIELDLKDIFLDKISTKLNIWFDQDICDELDRQQEVYQTLNHSLFPQIKEVLG
jgi:hypothetical protein